MAGEISNVESIRGGKASFGMGIVKAK